MNKAMKRLARSALKSFSEENARLEDQIRFLSTVEAQSPDLQENIRALREEVAEDQQDLVINFIEKYLK